MGKVLLEICVDSVESAKAAVKAGIGRLEVCSALSEGGLTPTPGFVDVVKAALPGVSVFAMLRPRRGDFCFGEEFKVLLKDMELLKAARVDGFVFGALTKEGEIDEELCSFVVNFAGDLPVTFHRAFDLTKEEDCVKNCAKIVDLGFKRLLTSGFRATAEEGIETIKMLNEKFGDKITIMPGAGITVDNVRKIADASKCREIHASARKPKNQTNTSISMGGSAADMEPQMVTSTEVVRQMIVNLLEDVYPPQHVICLD